MKIVLFGPQGDGHIFFEMPKTERKELFPIIVHEQHFAVPARRIYRLLSPTSVPFEE